MRMLRPVTSGLLIATLAIAAGGLTTPAAADAPGHARLQDALDKAVVKANAPGIVAEVKDGDRTWFGSAGVSDTKTGRKRQQHERFRTGSASKTFTAIVVLQLAADRKLSLDDTVDKWLPGLVQGNGYDGGEITIRQLLNHTSGIFNYGNDPGFFAKGVGAEWFKHRYDAYTPKQLVDIALANPPYAKPGKRFTYSNTNYTIAAMIIEEATGRTFEQELTQRIIRPLKLTGTYLPGAEAKIRGRHPVHYSTLFSQDPEPEVHDATDMNQSYGWASGSIVSTTGDLSRFIGALLGGRLLPPAQQREMFTTVSTEGANWIPDTRYGLGIFTQKLPCGVSVWGTGGATYGSWSYAMGSRDGRRLVASQVNGDFSGLGVFTDVLAAEFCPPEPR